MTSIIKDIEEHDMEDFDHSLTSVDLKDIILDPFSDISVKFESIKELLNAQSESSVLELTSVLSSMYQLSGTRVLEDLFHLICESPELTFFIKFECCKSLLNFSEFYDRILDVDDDATIAIKAENKKNIENRNKERTCRAYESLDKICQTLDGTPTPCRLEIICILMGSVNHKIESNSYFIDFVRDDRIDCEFKYKTILSLEIKEGISDTHFFLENACFEFMNNSNNLTYYRNLAGQYLLQNIQLSEERLTSTELMILSFAKDEELDYDRRADSADVLLRLGREFVKTEAREIIQLLAEINGEVRNIFENAQNVHVQSVEESVTESLQFLCELDTLKVEDKEIDFMYVKSKIDKMLENQRNSNGVVEMGNQEEKECCFCGVMTTKYDIIDDNVFAIGKNCAYNWDKNNKISISVNRICMDRALYSKFNSTLSNILVKIWSYMAQNEHFDEMKVRLLEELCDMSGTCSSGYCSRLINVISGFGEFNIRISWQDQICSNFTGRLNSKAKQILNVDSPYYTSKLNEVVELWLNRDGIDIKKSIERSLQMEMWEDKCVDSLSCNDEQQFNIPMTDIIREYLLTNRQEKIQECVEEFSTKVLLEMTYSTYDWSNRQNFLLFFRTNLPSLKEELYEEFKDHISDTDFDLYMRKSVLNYETGY